MTSLESAKTKTVQLIEKTLLSFARDYTKSRTFLLTLAAYLEEETNIFLANRKQDILQGGENPSFDLEDFEAFSTELTDDEKEELLRLWDLTLFQGKWKSRADDGTECTKRVFSIGEWVFCGEELYDQAYCAFVLHPFRGNKPIDKHSAPRWRAKECAIQADIVQGLESSLSHERFADFITFISCHHYREYEYERDVYFAAKTPKRTPNASQRKKLLKKHSIDISEHLPEFPSLQKRKMSRSPEEQLAKLALECTHTLLELSNSLKNVLLSYAFLRNVIPELIQQHTPPEVEFWSSKSIEQAIQMLCRVPFRSGFRFGDETRAELKRVLSQIQHPDTTHRYYGEFVRIYSGFDIYGNVYAHKWTELGPLDKPNPCALKALHKNAKTTLPIEILYYGFIFVRYFPAFRPDIESNEDTVFNLLEWGNISSELLTEILIQMQRDIHNEALIDWLDFDENGEFGVMEHVRIFNQLARIQGYSEQETQENYPQIAARYTSPWSSEPSSAYQERLEQAPKEIQDIIEALPVYDEDEEENSWIRFLRDLQELPEDNLSAVLSFIEPHLKAWPEKVRIYPFVPLRKILSSEENWFVHRLATSLNLSKYELTSVEVEAIANAKASSRLKHLALDGYDLCDEDINVLANAKVFSGLKSLSLGKNNIGNEGAKALANATGFPGLQELVLEENDIGDEGVKALATSDRLTSLRGLDLDENLFGLEGIKALAESSTLAKLDWLHISRNPSGDEGARILAQSKTLTQLTTFGMGDSKLGLKGVEAIANSTAFSNLRELYLFENELGAKAFKAIANSTTLGKLENLYIRDSGCSRKMLKVLANSKSLVNLQSIMAGDDDNENIYDIEAKKAGFFEDYSVLRKYLLTPNEENWQWLLLLFENWPEASRKMAVDYAKPHLDDWPDELRCYPRLSPRVLCNKKSCWHVHQLAVTLVYEWKSLTPKSIEAIVSNEALSHLRRLQLTGCTLKSKVIQILTNTTTLTKLKELSLTHCDLTDKSAKAIANAGAFKNLAVLNLSNNQLTDKGAMALSESNILTNLKTLVLSGNEIQKQVLQTLLQSKKSKEA